MKHSPSTQAAVELFFTSILWGFGFVAAIWALEIFTPPELLFLRFILAFIVGEVFTWIFKKNKITKHEVKEGLIAGFILGLVLLLQTWGLLYTTATKSGFITSLYVVLIPLFLHFFWKQKTSPSTYINVAFALLGMVILISPDPQSVDLLFMNRGDLLTLLCAVFAAFHIIYIDLKSKKITNGFQFNNYQSLGAAIFCIPSLMQQGFSKGAVFNFKSYSIFEYPLALLGLLSLALGSSLLAFYIQIRAQRILKPSTASLFFLLEAPFALLFSILLLKEKLSSLQVLGVILLLLSCLKQLLAEHDEGNSEKKG